MLVLHVVLHVCCTCVARVLHTDEQLQHVDIYIFSNYYNLQSVHFELIPKQKICSTCTMAYKRFQL